ncbi:MAG: ABC transporter permease subunit [Chlorobi bacterium]|nr:ABC transporter permease subunit [Chlorobiota bacterium]
MNTRAKKRNTLIQILKTDIRQHVRSKSFWIYSALFAGFVAVMFATGITESQVVGFVGLSRLMITFMQVSMVILPIYVLISTVRSLVGDRENGVLEYLLSLPVSFSSYYWAKFFSRFFVIYVPVFLAFLGAALWGLVKKLDVPWDLFVLYSALLAVMVFFFLGLSMYLSAVSKSQEMAVSTAFIIWLFLVAFMDILLIGILLKWRVSPEPVIWTALLNPLQVFRTGSLILFDPKLTVLGPVSYYILDTVGRPAFIAYSLIYPVVTGGLFAWLGHRYFKNHDVV